MSTNSHYKKLSDSESNDYTRCLVMQST